LQQAQKLSIDLIDISGRLVGKFASGQYFAKGQNSFRVEVPQTLSKGTYFLKINDEKIPQQSKSLNRTQSNNYTRQSQVVGFFVGWYF
jgi:hypothetical protein